MGYGDVRGLEKTLYATVDNKIEDNFHVTTLELSLVTSVFTFPGEIFNAVPP